MVEQDRAKSHLRVVRVSPIGDSWPSSYLIATPPPLHGTAPPQTPGRSAKKAGIRYPTALTRQAWERYVKVGRAVGETEASRLKRVLEVFRTAAAKAAPLDTTLRFNVWVYDGDEAQYCGLKAVCGPDDDLEPVITIMDWDEN